MDCPICTKPMTRISNLRMKVDEMYYRGETWKCPACKRYFQRTSFQEVGSWADWSEVKAGTPPPLPYWNKK